MISVLIRKRIAILLFLSNWCVYGAMTNAKDLHFYGLYQMGAESIVKYGTFTVGHSKIEEMRDAGDGDIFYVRDKRLPAKQPGSFLISAIPYYFISHLGFDFERNYDEVSAVLAWMTAGFFGALNIAYFYEVLLLLGFSVSASALTSLTYGLATTFFPYTGVSHHDVLATSFLVFAFFNLKQSINLKRKDFAIWSGALLAITLFFSMLQALIVAGLLLYGITRLSKKNAAQFLSGFALGNIPLALYNWHYFGNPLIQANMAGNYQNTFFHPDLELFLRRLHEYFDYYSNISITKNMPVLYLGFLGVFFLSKKLRAEKFLVLGVSFLHLMYLLSIGTEGHCQYGPRYLIPLIPFVMMGLAAFLDLKISRVIIYTISVPLILYCLVINTLGAFGNTLCCTNMVEFGFSRYVREFDLLAADYFPLIPACFVLAIITVLFGFWSRTQKS